MTKFLSKKFFAALLAILSTLSAVAAGAIDPITGFAYVAIEVLAYLAAETSVDVARARWFTQQARAVLDEADRILAEVEARTKPSNAGDAS